MKLFPGSYILGIVLVTLGIALGIFLKPDFAAMASSESAKNAASTPEVPGVLPANEFGPNAPLADGAALVNSENPTQIQNPQAVTAGPTYYRTYAGFEFQPGVSDLTFASSGAGVYAVVLPGGGPSFRRALDLPNGAQILSVSMYAIDNSPTFNMTVQLARSQPSVSVSQTFPFSLSTNNTLVSSTVQTVSASGSPILTIDNSQYAYSLRYPPTLAGSSHVLVGVKVEFTVPTSFLPLVTR